MPTRDQKVVINFAGGWATDFGPAFSASPQGNAMTLPFLLTADNVFYELDGGIHKVGGTTKLNASQITEAGVGVPVQGVFDYWKQGTVATESQQIVAYVGTQIVKISPTTGVVTQLKSGLQSGKQPCFEVFKDSLILTTDSTVDTPQTWDQVAGSTSNLGGSPPKFSFMVKHKNRIFASGVATNASRLYYSAALDATTWAGLDAGSIDIDPDDGDRITGLISHKNELIVFKGPNKLSIHRLAGSAPTGTDAFVRVPFITGVGAVNHNSIFRLNDDVVFASPRGLHSLAATAAFGNYIEAFLSRPILTYYQDLVNHAGLNTIWGVNYQGRGLAIWTVPTASTTKDTYLVYDYRFQPGRWSRWFGYLNANSLAIVQSSSRVPKVYAGTTDGFVHLLNTTDRSIAGGQAYTATVNTPFLNFGTSATTKSVGDTFLSIVPKGSYSFNFGHVLDSQSLKTFTVSESGSDPLG